MAYKIMLIPTQTISNIACRVSFPELSRHHEDNEIIREKYLLLTNLIATLAFPIMTVLALHSDLVITILFGQRWHDASQILLILSLAGLIQTVIFPVGQLYLIGNRPDLMFKVTVAMAILTVFGFTIGLTWGIVGVATAYVVVTLISFPLEILYPARLFNFGVLDVLDSIKLPLFNIIVASLLHGLTESAFSDLSDIYSLALSSSFFFVLYYLISIWNNRAAITRIISIVSLRRA
jgi:PST family polysaccharide transporter